MSCVIPLQFAHWSRRQLAGNESGSTCWPWLPTWGTSISTLPTGTWKPHLSFCASIAVVTEDFVQGGQL